MNALAEANLGIRMVEGMLPQEAHPVSIKQLLIF